MIVATGGLSVPKTGSDGAGLAILRRLGHVVHPTYPALTPMHRRRRRLRVARRRLAAGDRLRARRTAGRPRRPAASCSPITATAALRCSTCRTSWRGRAGRSGRAARLQVQWTALDDGRLGPALRPSGTRTVGGRAATRAARAAGRRAARRAPAWPATVRSPSSAGRSACGSSRCSTRGELPVDWRRGLPEGRGHGRRHQPRGGGSAYAGEPPAPRTLHLRRGAGCVRPDWRLQLPLGLGDGAGGGAWGGGRRVVTLVPWITATPPQVGLINR